MLSDESLKNLVRDWAQKAKNENKDPFSKFLFGYVCLNALMAYLSQENTDKEMKEWLKNNPNVVKDIFHEICNDRDFFLPQLETLKRMSPISDARIRNQEPDVIIPIATDFNAVLDAIYMIRCNLFHGRKDPSNRRDQDLVILGGKILDKWMSSLVPRL